MFAPLIGAVRVDIDRQIGWAKERRTTSLVPQERKPTGRRGPSASGNTTDEWRLRF
jgi:hypothetical protein